MEHKAYLFDRNSFDQQLATTLFEALETGETDLLRGFINDNLASITRPWDGEPAGTDWEDLLEIKDPHHYGDFALTKYYKPDNYGGLVYEWLDIPDSFTTISGLFLGELFGPSGNFFDPGKYGSYFILPLTLKLKQEAILRVISDPLLEAFQESIQNYLQLLTEAQKSGAGIYITF